MESLFARLYFGFFPVLHVISHLPFGFIIILTVNTSIQILLSHFYGRQLLLCQILAPYFTIVNSFQAYSQTLNASLHI